MKKDLIQSAAKTIRKYEMVKEGDRVVVALSGGPDSIFLLYALWKLKENLKISIAAAHLDHGLRGRASEADSEFSRHVSDSFGISCFCRKVDLAAHKRDNKALSVEEVARKLRYGFLIETAKRINADAVATGHTLDDHAETVLMRIIKGTAMRGVIGIPPLRKDGDIKIIRPLIGLTKAEIRGFLSAHVIPYRIDFTNLEDIYFRNRVRNRVMPYLARYNPRIKYALANLADSLREDFEFIEEEKRNRASFSFGDSGRVKLRLKDIIIQPRALRREITREALLKAGSNIKKLSYNHWKDIDTFIQVKQKGKCIDLPGDIRVKKTKDSLEFFRRQV